MAVYGTLPSTASGPLASFEIDGSKSDKDVPKLGAGIDSTAIPDRGVYGNVLFYFTGNLTAGVVHNLTITSLADNVMYLDYLTVPSEGYSPMTLVEPNTVISDTTPSSQHVSAGAIAGGIIGGIVSLMTVILLLVFLRRRRQRYISANGIDDGRSPYLGRIYRFNYYKYPSHTHP